MNSLPELAGGRIRYRLPLGEETALRLADVLLAESAERVLNGSRQPCLPIRRWQFGRFSSRPASRSHGSAAGTGRLAGSAAAAAFSQVVGNCPNCRLGCGQPKLNSIACAWMLAARLS